MSALSGCADCLMRCIRGADAERALPSSMARRYRCPTVFCRIIHGQWGGSVSAGQGSEMAAIDLKIAGSLIAGSCSGCAR